MWCPTLNRRLIGRGVPSVLNEVRRGSSDPLPGMSRPEWPAIPRHPTGGRLTRYTIARFNPDGTLDHSFGTNRRGRETLHQIKTQTDH
jgi:hypothetical protein